MNTFRTGTVEVRMKDLKVLLRAHHATLAHRHSSNKARVLSLRDLHSPHWDLILIVTYGLYGFRAGRYMAEHAFASPLLKAPSILKARYTGVHMNDITDEESYIWIADRIHTHTYSKGDLPQAPSPGDWYDIEGPLLQIAVSGPGLNIETATSRGAIQLATKFMDVLGNPLKEAKK